MEQICTDVIHYEKREGWIHRKLIHYRGTMSDFVKKQPQAKHYFELATSDDLVFKFPEPGRLEGDFIQAACVRFTLVLHFLHFLTNVIFVKKNRNPNLNAEVLRDGKCKLSLSWTRERPTYGSHHKDEFVFSRGPFRSKWSRENNGTSIFFLFLFHLNFVLIQLRSFMLFILVG
jgi:hypothetical protein